MFYYAQINENNICVAVSQLSEIVEKSNMIQINEYDENFIFRKYEDSQWSEEKFVPKHTPTYEEERQKYIKLIQEATLLGESEEVIRLQEEWTAVKASYETN